MKGTALEKRMLWILILAFVFNVKNTSSQSLLNLAYQKPTWQSSTLGAHSSHRAVDGRKSDFSEAGNQCALSRDYKDTATWFVDLETIQNINQIKIYPRTEGRQWNANNLFARRFAGYSIYVSNTTDSDDGILCHRDTNLNALFVSAIATIQCSVPGRYVIYYNTREGSTYNSYLYSLYAYVDLCEVEVYGCPPGFYGLHCTVSCPKNCKYCEVNTGVCQGGCNFGYEGHQCQHYTRQNLALHQPSIQSSIYEGNLQGRAVDGRMGNLSAHGGQCVVTSDYLFHAYVYTDLGGFRSIERIVIYFMTGNQEWDARNHYTSTFLGFSVVVSNTTNPNSGTVCYQDKEYTKHTIPPVIDISCSGYVIYRNERLPGLTYPPEYSLFAYANICELQVFGCSIAEYNGPNCAVPCKTMCENYQQNLAFGKPTWQSSTKSPPMTSDKAVDGKKGLHSSVGGCTATADNAQSATWWVNLGRISSINHVVIYFRTDDKIWDYRNYLTSYPLGFTLFISNTSNRHDGVMCFQERNFRKNTIPAKLFTRCPYKGQFVIYHIERVPGMNYPSDYSTDAHADLCEVEVFGCPSPILDVPQCSRPCPANCLHCYPNTGVCTQCKVGYAGENCELVCFVKQRLSLDSKETLNVSNYHDIYTEGGLTVYPPGDGEFLLRIYINFPRERYDIANVSFTIGQTVSFMVFLATEKQESVTKRSPYYGPLKNAFTIKNPYNAKVESIAIVIYYDVPFTISNLLLSLRKCFNG